MKSFIVLNKEELLNVFGPLVDSARKGKESNYMVRIERADNSGVNVTDISIIEFDLKEKMDNKVLLTAYRAMESEIRRGVENKISFEDMMTISSMATELLQTVNSASDELYVKSVEKWEDDSLIYAGTKLNLCEELGFNLLKLLKESFGYLSSNFPEKMNKILEDADLGDEESPEEIVENLKKSLNIK